MNYFFLGCSGLCRHGSCDCDAPWTDVDCSKLEFGAVPENECGPGCVYHGYGGNSTTSWGGSPIVVESRYYLVAAEMVNKCSLSSWTSNSQVVIAVADAPEGPFAKQQTAIKPWAHNPEVVVVDGTYLIFTLGNGTKIKPEENCNSSLASTYNSTRAPEHNQTFAAVLHYSQSINGPWTPYPFVMEGLPSDGGIGNWNPAPVVMPDNSIRIMVHTDTTPWVRKVVHLVRCCCS